MLSMPLSMLRSLLFFALVAAIWMTSAPLCPARLPEPTRAANPGANALVLHPYLALNAVARPEERLGAHIDAETDMAAIL